MKNICPFPLILSLLIVFSACGVCYAQRTTNARNARQPQIAPKEPDPLHDWVTVPARQTIYPPDARPMEFDTTMSWPTDLKPATPQKPVAAKDMVIVLPDTDYKINDPKIILGPPESGLVVVAGGVDTFFSKRNKELEKSVLSLVSLKHEKAVTKIFPSEMNAYDISPNGKFLAVTIKPQSGNWLKMNHLLILRLDDGSFAPVAHYTPFDDAPSVRQKNDTVAIRDVLWLNNKQLFLVSKNDLGIQLDLTTHTVGFGMYPEMESFISPYTLTPDKKYIMALHHAYNDERNGTLVKGMAIYDTEDGGQLGYLKLSPDRPDKADYKTLSKIAGVSSNGRLMAAAGVNDHICIWDVLRGRLIGSSSCSVHDRAEWINNRFIFCHDCLYDAKEQEICSKYDRKTNILDYYALEDKLLYLAVDDTFHPTEHRLVCSQVIPPNMEEYLESAARRKERMMGPGDEVSLELNLRLSSGDQNRIEQHIRKKCAENGWKVVAPGDSEYRLVAFMSEPGDEIEVRMSYHGNSIEPVLATQKVRPYWIGYSISKGQQVIWADSISFGPYRSYESVEEFNKHLTEGMREKPDWFLERSFPATITRGHMESEKRNATITFNGVEFE